MRPSSKMYAERSDPLDAVGEAVDQGMPEVRITEGHDLVDHLARGRRPGIAREADRPAEVARDLDHEDPGAVMRRPGGGGEAGHAASHDEEVDRLMG